MKLIVSCNICQIKICEVNKDQITDADVNLYKTDCFCDIDGPFQQYDGDGNPLPLDKSNIVTVVTS